MKLSELIPTTWLDPLLTGPDAVLPKDRYDYNGKDIERLLLALKKRIEEAESSPQYVGGRDAALEEAAVACENTPTVLCQDGGFMSERCAKAVRALKSKSTAAQAGMTEERARKILDEQNLICKDGGLYCLGWYVAWTPGKDTATLDAQFSADDLEAIAWWMRYSQSISHGD